MYMLLYFGFYTSVLINHHAHTKIRYAPELAHICQNYCILVY
jgi:hypothetical protein